MVFTSTNRDYISTFVYFIVGWLDCQQDCTKNYFLDFHRTWTDDGSQPRIDPVNFGADPDRATDP